MQRCRMQTLAPWSIVLTVGLSLAAAASAAAARGDSPAARERTAVEMCASELAGREKGRDARVERTIRSDYRNGKVYWEGDMTVRRNGPDVTRRVDCVVAFDGKNRIVKFETTDGGSSAEDRATRACRGEAERRGYKRVSVSGSKDVERWGRLLFLRTSRGEELLCVYRTDATVYRRL